MGQHGRVWLVRGVPHTHRESEEAVTPVEPRCVLVGARHAPRTLSTRRRHSYAVAFGEQLVGHNGVMNLILKHLKEAALADLLPSLCRRRRFSTHTTREAIATAHRLLLGNLSVSHLWSLKHSSSSFAYIAQS